MRRIIYLVAAVANALARALRVGMVMGRTP